MIVAERHNLIKLSREEKANCVSEMQLGQSARSPTFVTVQNK